MQHAHSKEEKLKSRLKTIQAQQDLTLHMDLITRLSAELGISVLECAAALSFLNQPNLYPGKIHREGKFANGQKSTVTASTTQQKLVRYRLDVGQKHQVLLDEIINVLVEVSGVERNSIGKLDIRNHYSIVELPDGMPADIYQLLSETQLNNQKLNLKRIKYHRRFYRRNNKKQQTKA